MDNLKETKNNKKISQKQKMFIKYSLRTIGVNASNNGLPLLQKGIIYAYTEDMITINLEKIFKYLSSQSNSLTHRGVESIVRYSFYNINTKQLSNNYEKIFGIEFCSNYFNLRTLISDFIDVLDSIE